MPAPLVIRSSFWEGSDPGWTLAQVVDKNNSLFLQAGVQSIALRVYDDETEALIHGPTALTVSAVIFNTLQGAGGIWQIDALGYNFASYQTDAAIFATTPAEGGKAYRFDYAITSTSGNGSGVVPVVHVMACKPRIPV